jgi:hypothetical protein
MLLSASLTLHENIANKSEQMVAHPCIQVQCVQQCAAIDSNNGL